MKSRTFALAMVLLVSLVGCSDDDDPVVPASTGTIVIDLQPEGIEAPWQLAAPNYLTHSGTGEAILVDMPLGCYTVTWFQMVGWDTPNEETLALTGDDVLTLTGNYVSRFVYIPPGTFMMGSPENELGRDTDRETQHEVTLTRGFYISKYEVTEELWDAVMGDGDSTSQLPKHVPWAMAVEFCNALSLLEGLTPAYSIDGTNGDVTWHSESSGYRLPTEAEWEYACRASSQTAFSNGPITHPFDCEPLDPHLDIIGWYCGNTGSGFRDVGQKAPNSWGLYDMHGNAREWIWDGYRADYENLDSIDPVHNVGVGLDRVQRGGGCFDGSCFDEARHCRSARRQHVPRRMGPEIGSGFRPVRSAF